MTPARSHPSAAKIREALADIIEGKNVKRSRHDLSWGKKDCTDLFVEVLLEKGFRPCNVAEVEVVPGERVPAFYLLEGTAFFGWIFWEKFTERRMRKLFGSTVRNAKGDWAIQIPEKKTAVIYANISQKTAMDIDHLTGL
jgi:hypothetical protein